MLTTLAIFASYIWLLVAIAAGVITLIAILASVVSAFMDN